MKQSRDHWFTGSVRNIDQFRLLLSIVLSRVCAVVSRERESERTEAVGICGPFSLRLSFEKIGHAHYGDDDDDDGDDVNCKGTLDHFVPPSRTTMNYQARLSIEHRVSFSFFFLSLSFFNLPLFSRSRLFFSCCRFFLSKDTLCTEHWDNCSLSCTKIVVREREREGRRPTSIDIMRVEISLSLMQHKGVFSFSLWSTTRERTQKKRR